MRTRRSSALRGIAGDRRGGEEAGTTVRIAHSVDDPAEAAELLHALLAPVTGPGKEAPTALVVQHPTAYQHILASVSALGRRVPDDLTIVVIGSLPGDPSCARLPRVELPVQAMGSTAVRMAVAAADSRRPAKRSARRPRQGTAQSGASRHVLLTPELVGHDRLRPPPPTALRT